MICVLCDREIDDDGELHARQFNDRNICFVCWGKLCIQLAEDEAEQITRRKELFENLTGITQVVINKCHGGFGLSNYGVMYYLDQIGTPYSTVDREDRYQTLTYGKRIFVDGKEFDDRSIRRDDPALVRTVLTLGGKAASGRNAQLDIVTVPANVDWEIDEYDGLEWVAERHRIWR